MRTRSTSAIQFKMELFQSGYWTQEVDFLTLTTELYSWRKVCVIVMTNIQGAQCKSNLLAGLETTNSWSNWFAIQDISCGLVIVRPYAGTIVLVLLVILYSPMELDVSCGGKNFHEPKWVMQIRRSSMFCPHQKIKVRVSMYCIPKSSQTKYWINLRSSFTIQTRDRKFEKSPTVYLIFQLILYH